MMIPALNGLFDVALKRDILMKAHIPDTIVYMLLILALVSSLIGGVTTTSIGKRDWLIVCCFVLFTSLVVYITLDLGRPLRGIVRADAAAASMNELRKMFE
jgi:Flp pilus assembly protein protease CpaA